MPNLGSLPATRSAFRSRIAGIGRNIRRSESNILTPDTLQTQTDVQVAARDGGSATHPPTIGAVPPDLPVPTFELADRVGSLQAGGADPLRFYLDYGRRIRDEILSLLPTTWDWRGKRILDFGCGAGRVLRHLLPEAEQGAELHGCDIDGPSIDWLAEALSPPLHVFRNRELPPLDRPDATFDVVYAVSVFTHLTDQWASWLLELRRVLKPEGLLIATFLGEGISTIVTGEQWAEDRIGMNVINYGQSWDDGGPTVLHSPWWIRAHWGRAFEILRLEPRGFAADPPSGHGVAVMRPRAATLTPAALEAVEPGEPREIDALRHNVAQLHRESADARRWLAELQRSPSWRLTAPLRRAKRMLGIDGSR